MNIKLYEHLPRGVAVDGKYYKCDFDYRNVLKMLDIMQRDDIYPPARDYLCAKCLCKPPKNARNVYVALLSMLFDKPPEGGAKAAERITSFEQDAGLIRAAFRQVYGIDLYREKLTWFEFGELLNGLPEGSKYQEVLGIRARPLPPPTKYNAKEREWLINAKRAVALHLTDAEQARKYDKDVSRIFSGLLSMIPKDVKKDG